MGRLTVETDPADDLQDPMEYPNREDSFHKTTEKPDGPTDCSRLMERPAGVWVSYMVFGIVWAYPMASHGTSCGTFPLYIALYYKDREVP